MANDLTLTSSALRIKGSSGGCICRRAQGFTIVELMVVVAILGILASIGVPAMSSLMQKNRLSAAASAFQVSLSLARSEAIKRGIDARVTVAANSAAGSWINGWTVFVDKTADANGAVAPASNTTGATAVTRLEVVAAPSSPISFGQTGSLNYVMYNGQGRVVDVNGGPGNQSFYFYDGSSERYCVVISVGGRVRVDRVGSGQSCSTS